MRNRININRNWHFHIDGHYDETVDLPHTWNAKDGQDGGNDYLRAFAVYEKHFASPAFDRTSEQVYLEFDGVNSECEVFLNGQYVLRHEGGYSRFRADITDKLQADDNCLTVHVSNIPNDHVYPQKADFTFYGGIYRDVNLLVVNRKHFDLDTFGGDGARLIATPVDHYENADIRLSASANTAGLSLLAEIQDQDGSPVNRHSVSSSTADFEDTFLLPHVHLWNGTKDPYLYTAVLTLKDGDTDVDRISFRFGVRDFFVDPKKGFFLNGKSYPLHGVSRHQDRKGVGNALTKEMHREDMDLITEIGANTIRLAHYQHAQYFYDLCDERGMIVWAEIPYISEHLPKGRENTVSQMKELITQNFHHASIVCWGVSNEITISTKDRKDMLSNHRQLNDLCHQMDPTRLTALACYAMCGPFNKSAHITDLVSWNLYLGWYMPGLFLNDLFMRFFHLVFPNRCLGYSEYGCEGMPNLHAERPRRGDHTEEYQAHYHEYMIRCFERNPYLWATHVWNMFDFAADARNQGGEPGMNHKGLVTFDRKTKKDSFYLYKAWWSDEPFVHICSKRFHDRTRDTIEVKVYSNRPKVTLYQDGKKIGTKEGERVFSFLAHLEPGKEHLFRAEAEGVSDTARFERTDRANPSYSLKDTGDKGANWASTPKKP